MLHRSFAYRTFSVLLLLAMVFSFAAQTTIPVQAAPDTPVPFLDDFAGNAPPSGFVPFADSWDGANCGGTPSPTTLVVSYPNDTLPTVPEMNNTPVMQAVYNITANGSWGCGAGYAGVIHNFSSALDLSGYQNIRFWFKGSNSGNALRFQIQSRGATAGDAVLFEYGFADNSSAWRYFSIPWTSFTLRNDYNPGRDHGLPTTLDTTQMWGYAILLPGASSGTIALDEVSVTGYGNMVDLESGVPAGFGPFNGSGSSVPFGLTTANLPTVPAQDGTHVINVNNYNVTDYGGITYPFTASEDWSHYQGLSFWYKGGSTNGAMRIELKTSGANAGDANLFQYEFTDNFSDWRFFNIPWSAFTKRTDYNPGAYHGDTIDHSVIWGYSVLIPNGTGSFQIDDIAPYGGGNDIIVPKAKFSASAYNVNENAGTATITVNLSAATTVATSVDYATSNGSAVAGADYTAANGVLNFAAGETTKTFTVDITDNTVYNAPKTINMTLSNPSAASLGAPSTAVLTIIDNEVAPDTKVVDDYSGSVAPLYNPFGTAIGFANWGSENGNVQLSTVSVIGTDPLALPGQTGSKSLLKVDYNIGSWGGFTHALENGNDWVSQDWSRYDGVSFWLYGNNTGGTIQTEVFDNQALGTTGDSAERYYYRITDNYTGWQFFRIPFSAFQRRTDYQPGGAPADGLNLTAVSGYSFGFPAAHATAYIADYKLYGDLSAHPATMRVQSAAYAYGANEGSPITVKVWLNEPVASDTVTVDYAVTDGTALAGVNYDGSNATGTLTFSAGEAAKTVVIQTLADGKVKPTLNMTFTLSNASNATLGWKTWATLGVINTTVPDPSMIDDFENGLPTAANLATSPAGSVTFSSEKILSSSPNAVPGQFPVNYALSGNYAAGAKFNRLFGQGRDLTGYDALRFWYKGSNSGQPVKVNLLDGQAVSAPSAWTQAWSDEFNGAAGTAPDATYWNHDIGGQGWGNNEWEYYTDSTDNAAQDGNGNLVITAKPSTDASLQCANGPAGSGTQTCAYTSARLLTKDKIDFAYGRVEASIKIPHGQGIWPAFWMLGSDIESNPWPASGEIDIMENIGKDSELQNVYGTIHGPGYSGGSGIGSGPYHTGVNLYEGFHTYAVEWEPTQIRWYFDGYNYFTANKSDVPAGREWVFNKPFFIIMNVAVGGGWPGYPDGTTSFPQSMTVDYVRVSQGPDNAQRFESTFVDNSTNWKLVTLPYAGFVPSATQPAGAATNAHPVLTNVRGYGFELPSTAGSFKLDDVRGTVSTNVDVTIAGTSQGTYNLFSGGSTRQSYNANNGPVKVSTSSTPIVAAERVNYFVGSTVTSYSEMMGLPNSQLDTTYWFPWYKNDSQVSTQIRIGNVSGSTATVHISIAGAEVAGSPYTLTTTGNGQSMRLEYAANNGPVKIWSDQNIVATERVNFFVSSTVASYSEMMGLPNRQLDITYWFPWYKNVGDGTDTQIRIGNVSGSTATVHIYIAGAEVVGSPYTLTTTGDGQSMRLSYVANNGPVKIVSDQNIVASERVNYSIDGVVTSYAEMMGQPNSQLDTTYWFPWYKNDSQVDTQIRIGNVSGSEAHVHVYIGTAEMPGSPFTLTTTGSTQSMRLSFTANDGPVKIVSDQNIVATERVNFFVGGKVASYSEMMGLPNLQLDTAYWFPWYKNVGDGIDTQLRFGIP